MREVADKGATGNKQWKMEFERLIHGIVEQVQNQMGTNKFEEGQKILQIHTDPRFLRADIIKRLSADPMLKKLGCCVEKRYEDFIVFRKS